MAPLRRLGLVLPLLLPLLLGACAGAPSTGAPVAAAEACRVAAEKAAPAIAARRFYTFVTWPVSTRLIERNQREACLARQAPAPPPGPG